MELITCLLIPTGKLEPLVARLMGATTATRVGDGADCLFFGGNAGGGLKQSKEPYQTRHPTKCFKQMLGYGRWVLSLSDTSHLLFTLSTPIPSVPKN